MENTTARDILGNLPPLPLTDYHSVRVDCGGDDWIELEIRDGKPAIRANRGLLIRLNVSNCFILEFPHDR